MLRYFEGHGGVTTFLVTMPYSPPVFPFCEEDHQRAFQKTKEIGDRDFLVPRFLDLVLTKGSGTLGRESAAVRTRMLGKALT